MSASGKYGPLARVGARRCLYYVLCLSATKWFLVLPPHTVASNMVKVSHALNHSATEAVNIYRNAIMIALR